MNSPIIVSYPDGFVAGYNELSVALNACTGRGNCLITIYPILVGTVSDWKDYPTVDINANIAIPTDSKVMLLPNAIFTGTHTGSSGVFVDLNYPMVPAFQSASVPLNISTHTGSLYFSINSNTSVGLVMRGTDGILRSSDITLAP